MSNAQIFAIGTPPSFKQQIARALEADPDTITWVPSVTAAEELLFKDSAPADVLVLSPEIKEPDALGLADFVGSSSPSTAVILVRDHSTPGLLPAAMRAGIRDVVDMSRGSHELQDALRRAMQWSQNLRTVGGNARPTSGARGMVISIFSSKGGAGKTFLSCNLAAAIAKKTGKDTALVDLDVRIGDVFAYFGREPTLALDDFVALGDRTDRDMVLSSGTSFGDHLWGFGVTPDPAAGAIAGQSAGRILRTLRGMFRFTVVDASAEYSDQALAAFDISDEVCLIAGLDVVGIRHLAIALETLASLGMTRERFKIILNRVDGQVGLSPEDVERVLSVKVKAAIPTSQLVPLSLNRGRPVYWEEPKSDVSSAIDALADRLITPPDASGRKKSKKKAAEAHESWASAPVLRLFGISS